MSHLVCQILRNNTVVNTQNPPICVTLWEQVKQLEEYNATLKHSVSVLYKENQELKAGQRPWWRFW